MLSGVYPYSAKVIRSSMGYVFDINLISLNYTELVDFLSKNKYNLVCADMSGVDLVKFKTPEKIALVIGNEGNGVSNELINIASHIVKIPMNNGVESLNASVSASIIMYKLGE
jgi:TrmH family RNA methyltransferase